MTGAISVESSFTYVPAATKEATSSEKKPAKAEKAKGADEDLDAILAEFGVVVDGSTSKKKKKSGKK